MSQAKLAELQEKYEEDRVFQALRKSGSRYVGAKGNSDNPKVFIVGEAPGKEEDEKGIPFVGASGLLLDEWLKVAHIPYAAVYITNVVKYRPIIMSMGMRANRTPTLREQIASTRYLLEEHEAVGRPSVILTLGVVATRAILGYCSSILNMMKRKVVYVNDQFPDNSIFVSYHPSYILRNYNLKEESLAYWRWIGDSIGGRAKKLC